MSENPEKVSGMIIRKFLNQIYLPLRRLLAELAYQPYCVDPQSNHFLHYFEGLTLHVNHFREKHDGTLEGDKRVSDLANSIKHIRSAGRTTYDLNSCVLYEYGEDQGFRFIRHSISAIDRLTKEEFDAVEMLCERVNRIARHLNTQLPSLAPIESNLAFSDVVVLRHDPELSSSAESLRIKFFENGALAYTPVDPAEVNLVVIS